MQSFFAFTGSFVHGQYLLSSGSYSQNFNTLSSSGTANLWTDNSTLLGWYAQSTNTTIVVTDYRADNGGSNSGDLDSYGSTGSSDRALGSLASGTSATIGYGLRLKNDTALSLGDITVGYTGEQWRNGGTNNVQALAFSYLVSASPITSPDVPGISAWTAFSPLTFTAPIGTLTAAALDGNAAANRTTVSSVLTGLTLNAGDELFIRWIDINDLGNDHGLAVDDVSVTFAQVPEPTSAAILGGFGLLGLLMAARRRN